MKAVINRFRQWRRKWRGTPQLFLRRILCNERFVAVDAGAAHGLPAHWEPLAGVAQIYAFEPHSESFDALQQHFAQSFPPHLFTVLPIALAGTTGKRTLYVTNVPTGSSLLKPRVEYAAQYGSRDYFLPCREVTIETRTLQSVFDNLQENRIDAIKLDIQGAELEVLQGLDAIRLQNVLVIELEVALRQVYEDQPDFGAVDRFLKDNGLELFDVRVARHYRPLDGDPAGYQERVFSVYRNSPTISARACEFDVLYFRNPQSLIEVKDKATLRKLVAAFCVYRFFSEAYDLTQRAGRAGVFSNAEQYELQEQIVTWHRRLHHRFYYRPSGVFNRIRDCLRFLHFEPYLRWAQYTFVEYPSC